MAYTKETVQALPAEKIIDHLIEAHKDNIARSNPDFAIIKTEVERRLKIAEQAEISAAQ